jgi:nicotinamidase-related amidase
MTITAIDPRTALVVIDLQKGLLAYPTLHPLPDIVARAAGLATAFRHRALPVVLVNAAARAPGRTDQPRNALAHAADWLEFVPELGQRPDDLVITKKSPGAFGDSSLAGDLRTRGVTQVVIVGVSTSNGVEATARGAYDLGFNVTLPVDAMTDMNVESHGHSIERVFPRIAETGTCADVLALLAQRGA